MVQLVLITYDIAEPKRLRRIAKTLESYGERMQKSVFECGLTPDALKSLTFKLERCIDPSEDSILIQPIHQHNRGNIRWQGKPPSIASEPFWIV
ncbi:CRISPR-associated endonuclease Cas2 [Marinomonas mediterranea]|uniref:CRISPR-associated endonuclease Cas2 n=1 Tax=Marinomonas mediterranea TaxID=119864 RepID=UPI0023491A1C|nr:CRISPR-associated endonuclease Cas2 [Marinomonas mediterranea]WCN08274.1 CRISPR-associated endonuclease Cas2 [Marinomonas mediterranea]